MPRTSTIAPARMRTYHAGTDVLEHPVDLLGRARFRAALDVGTVRVQRSDDPSALIPFTGTSILFNKRTWIGSRDHGFWEQIAPSSVTKTLLEADVRFLQNHNPDLLLARTNPAMRAAGASTLTLTPTLAGLVTDADMAPTSCGRDLAILLDLGVISQMSFAFEPLTWTRETLPDGSTLVTITELVLFDVSVVTYPAYEETDAGLRAAAFDAICRTNGFDPEDVARRYSLGGPMPELSTHTAAQRTAPPAMPTSLNVKRSRLIVPGQTRSLNGWTLSDLWPILDDAIVEELSTPDFNAYWYVWICDVNDEWFVYWDSRPGASDSCYMQCPYTVDAGGTVTLGTPVEVVMKTTYLPVADAGPEDEPPIGPDPAGEEMSNAPATATRSPASAPATATRTDDLNPGDRLRELRAQELATTFKE